MATQFDKPDQGEASSDMVERVDRDERARHGGGIPDSPEDYARLREIGEQRRRKAAAKSAGPAATELACALDDSSVPVDISQTTAADYRLDAEDPNTQLSGPVDVDKFQRTGSVTAPHRLTAKQRAGKWIPKARSGLGPQPTIIDRSPVATIRKVLPELPYANKPTAELSGLQIEHIQHRRKYHDALSRLTSLTLKDVQDANIAMRTGAEAPGDITTSDAVVDDLTAQQSARKAAAVERGWKFGQTGEYGFTDEDESAATAQIDSDDSVHLPGVGDFPDRDSLQRFLRQNF